MKIAVIGAGAIGSVISTYLSKSGLDVTLVGRSTQVDAIKKMGLNISGIKNERYENLRVITELDKKYDLTIFTVKTQDIDDAYGENYEFLEDTIVMTTQNGVQADNILSSHFERERIISSIVMFGATYVAPNKIIHNFEGKWLVGRPFGPNDEKVGEVVEFLKACFEAVQVEDIEAFLRGQQGVPQDLPVRLREPRGPGSQLERFGHLFHQEKVLPDARLQQELSGQGGQLRPQA